MRSASAEADEALAVAGGPRAVTTQLQAAPLITREDARAVTAALMRVVDGDPLPLSSLSGAGYIEELEGRFRSYLGARYALALSSGTAALHVALVACGVGQGQEVILSPYDWGAGVAAVLALGARPVFADIDPLTYTLDPTSVARRITPRTGAILVTHTFGHPAKMGALCSLAREHGIPLIEDCAHALGATYLGQPVGTFGAAACFSLGRGKPVTGGEGGMLVTDSEAVFQRAVRFSQHPLRQLREGLDPDPFSLNYRIHPLAALIACRQMARLEAQLKERRRVAQAITAALEGTPGIRPVHVAAGCSHAFYRYSPTYATQEWGGLPRDVVVGALAAEGVPISPGYIGEPLNRRLHACRPWLPYQRCPVAEARCRHEELGLHLPPEGPGLESWLQEVEHAVKKVHRQRRVLGAMS
jgi:dTDP-4-amino-4,6-dideoxygalactose transaminase